MPKGSARAAVDIATKVTGYSGPLLHQRQATHAAHGRARPVARNCLIRR